ncbi:hypothetical protein EB796_005655 [Bugula neritina]|uniref:Uncharacterized protein n=1 Tax=Bugula neritina TaxID=10212 RepID=A0A7J7KBN1_BUGNE|nr:hypothetical protein EB796_005655 [Bugula neritina]
MIDRDRNAILHIAAKFGNLEMAKRIVLTCAGANKTKEFLGLRNSEGKTAEVLANGQVRHFLKWARRQANDGCYCLTDAPYCLLIYAEKDRDGALTEKEALVSGLKQLEIESINECRASSKANILWAISKARETRFKSAMLVCMMCHGSDNSIFTEDNERVFYNEVLKEMNKVIPAGLPKVRE